AATPRDRRRQPHPATSRHDRGLASGAVSGRGVGRLAARQPPTCRGVRPAARAGRPVYRDRGPDRRLARLAGGLRAERGPRPGPRWLGHVRSRRRMAGAARRYQLLHRGRVRPTAHRRRARCAPADRRRLPPNLTETGCTVLCGLQGRPLGSYTAVGAFVRLRSFWAALRGLCAWLTTSCARRFADRRVSAGALSWGFGGPTRTRARAHAGRWLLTQGWHKNHLRQVTSRFGR